jgi:histidyl-tRNA synthetase
MPADENTNPPAPPKVRTPDPARYGQGPRGTRDFYPLEMAKRRWIEQRWRKVATRFGFEEIDGPRFEHLDTYTVKSGEGIVSELFSFTRAGGETEFALRPEFTPTLARMAAAKANALPKPIKWFSVGPYFRAERPQRGRLREFLQWNVDMLGDPSPEADAEVIACCVEFLRECGLTEKDVRVEVGDRKVMEERFLRYGLDSSQFADAFDLVDRREKLDAKALQDLATAKGLTQPDFLQYLSKEVGQSKTVAISPGATAKLKSDVGEMALRDQMSLVHAADVELSRWLDLNTRIVRGLAYYTGTVFEVHEATGAERAIAGGGRYDNLVELFGGPSTPAVGFAMGDVVLSLVLQDKGLMPSDAEIARELNLDPDVFVFSVDESLDAQAASFLARCRREGMHARKSYKTTRNIGKLFKDASNQRARVVVFFEPGDGDSPRIQVKDLSQSGAQQDFATADDALAFVRSL